MNSTKEEHIGHTNGALSVAWHPDGEQLATGGSTEIRLWNLPDLGLELPQGSGTAHSGNVNSLDFSPDGCAGVLCCPGVMRVQHTGLPSPEPSLRSGSKFLASCGDDFKVLMWNASNLQGGPLASDAAAHLSGVKEVRCANVQACPTRVRVCAHARALVLVLVACCHSDVLSFPAGGGPMARGW